MNAETFKKAAAWRAADMVSSGMIVGIGTGTTATYMIERLGQRVAEGLQVQGIPTSADSAIKAAQAGIPLTGFAAHSSLDIAIDGADEVERGSLHLIKGLGGALVREKIVAQAAKRFVIIVDGSKPVTHLGERAPVPVEVLSFGWECTAVRLAACGARGVKPRTDRVGSLFVSDNGNMILDCHFGPIADPFALGERIHSIAGVVEHGMFLNMTRDVLVATEQGIEEWHR